MLEKLEEVTVISAQEFEDCQEDMLFVDTELPFKAQPLVQVYVAIGETETELPETWQDSGVFGGDVLHTYEPGVIHTFISTELGDQLEAGQYVFIKVLAIGDANN